MRPRPTARPITTAVTVALALLLAGCGSATEAATPTVTTASPAGSAPPSAAPTSSTPPAEPSATPAGAYLSRAEYDAEPAARAGTKVVYFFHATWCPTCRATEEAIARDGIPAGLTLVKVDFDSENELRKKYGVTTQHTFVQVDPSGAELAKWTGSEGGAEILAKTV